MLLLGILVVFLFFVRCGASEKLFPITNYGAVVNSESSEACAANSAALLKALHAANQSSSTGTHGVAVVPNDGNYTFFWFIATDLFSVTLRIEGALKISNDVKNPVWPRTINDGGKFAAIMFSQCVDILVEGTRPFGSGPFKEGDEYNSLIDGQGFEWWLDIITTGLDFRPHMMFFNLTNGIEIRNLLLLNSPQFHAKIHDNINVHVHHTTVHVDVEGQKRLLQGSNRWDAVRDIPTFPLNTDGFDPAAIHVRAHDLYIQNYDDTVVAKPLHSGSWAGPCTSDFYVYNVRVKYGVGATIGSVPPDHGCNCIRNVTFENIEFDEPIKAIYVKSNPGDEGTGLIEDITYRNIYGRHPLWYPIWIGPQQMKEPGKNGTGCSFLFPMKGECPTQPRVTMRRIILENVTFVEGDSLPGVVLSDPQNPFTEFVFRDVVNNGWFVYSKDYYSKNIGQGCVVEGSTEPIPDGFVKKS